MSAYEELKENLKRAPKKWLITGVAGFIGSNLLEALLKLDQHVVGLDSFVTGKKQNLEEVRLGINQNQWKRFQFFEGDIVDETVCRKACQGIDFILHHAALASVPLSIGEPLRCHSSNVTGFLNILLAARDEKVQRVVYASSSAVYGDGAELQKVEERIGEPLSLYAATKYIDEIYAGVFARVFGLDSIGLRYFNVFGPRQDPEGAYAAVIPKWITAMLRRQPVYINGDGKSTRDFCFIEDIVQSNLLAASTQKAREGNDVYNIGLGQNTRLTELFALLKRVLRAHDSSVPEEEPVYRDFRPGDVRHSVADISKAQRFLQFYPTQTIEQGLQLAMDWYRRNLT